MRKIKKAKKHLDSPTIEKICGLIDGWKQGDKITWSKLIQKIELNIGISYTRQCLDRYPQIKGAFQASKDRVRPEFNGKPMSAELVAARQRIEKLEIENERLKMTNNALLEQFARWTYNASNRGLTPEFLNQNLPDIHRSNKY